jgi:hypothetical protein
MNTHTILIGVGLAVFVPIITFSLVLIIKPELVLNRQADSMLSFKNLMVGCVLLCIVGALATAILPLVAHVLG